MRANKVLAVAGAAGILTLAACSAGSTAPAASTAAPAPANKNVALVVGVNGSPFYEALACGAQAEAKKLGLSLKVSAPAQFAADAQIPVVDAVTAAHPA